MFDTSGDALLCSLNTGLALSRCIVCLSCMNLLGNCWHFACIDCLSSTPGHPLPAYQSRDHCATTTLESASSDSAEDVVPNACVLFCFLPARQIFTSFHNMRTGTGIASDCNIGGDNGQGMRSFNCNFIHYLVSFPLDAVTFISISLAAGLCTIPFALLASSCVAVGQRSLQDGLVFFKDRYRFRPADLSQLYRQVTAHQQNAHPATQNVTESTNLAEEEAVEIIDEEARELLARPQLPEPTNSTAAVLRRLHVQTHEALAAILLQGRTCPVSLNELNRNNAFVASDGQVYEDTREMRALRISPMTRERLEGGVRYENILPVRDTIRYLTELRRTIETEYTTVNSQASPSYTPQIMN